MSSLEGRIWGDILAFLWLALRTLTLWILVETTIGSRKVELVGGVQKSAKI